MRSVRVGIELFPEKNIAQSIIFFANEHIAFCFAMEYVKVYKIHDMSPGRLGAHSVRVK